MQLRDDGCLILIGPLDPAILMPKGYEGPSPEKLLDRAQVEGL